MRIGDIRTLTGANVYSHNPVLIMKLYLDDLSDKESNEISGFNERLLEQLPALSEHHCAKGRAGGFVERLEEGTYFGHVIEHIALELTEMAGIGVFHGKTRATGDPGCYNVVIEYKSEKATRYLLETAVAFVDALVKGEAFDLEKSIQEAKQIAARSDFGPSTKAIVEAARRRGIPHLRIGEGSIVQLGYGKQRKFIEAAMSDQTNAIAVDIASDKELTKTLLKQASLPVPYGEIVTTEEEALEAFRNFHIPVAIKPLNGCQGRGVSLNLISEAQVQNAFRIAQQFSREVLIEEMLRGRDYRVLVINHRLVAASERVPAHVIGDREHTIEQLIEFVNQDPQRGDGHDKSLTKIKIDPVLLETLRKRDLSIHSVPKRGEMVLLRETANLSTGGTAKDVTDIVHPEVKAACERAARIMGLDICGIDLILHDISEPLQPTDGIVEINAAPGLRMHLSPSEGYSRNVAEAIVEMLYPEGETGRIPIISITGTNGKTTITRLIAQLLSTTGKTVGMTTTDGIYINNQRIAKGDTTGPRSAQTILSDPAVEVAVLETARGGLVRGGLAYDWSDISIISNVRLDHIGQDGIETLDDILHIKQLLAERVREGGTLILNADDERLATLPEYSKVSRIKKNIIFFSMHPDHVVIKKHVNAGGTAYLLDKGWIVEVKENVKTRMLRAADIPMTLNGAANYQIANCLAAIAACRAYGMESRAIAEALTEFNSNEHNAGRSNLYKLGAGYVLIDYGHNPDAFTAICRLASMWQGRRVTGVIGVPGDRDNLVIEQAGRAAAQGFHRLIIREDYDLRGRKPGEVATLLHDAILAERPGMDCAVVLDETEAVRRAIQEMRADEIVVVFYEKLEKIRELLQEIGAVPINRLPDLKPKSREAAVNLRVARG